MNNCSVRVWIGTSLGDTFSQYCVEAVQTAVPGKEVAKGQNRVVEEKPARDSCI